MICDRGTWLAVKNRIWNLILRVFIVNGVRIKGLCFIMGIRVGSVLGARHLGEKVRDGTGYCLRANF